MFFKKFSLFLSAALLCLTMPLAACDEKSEEAGNEEDGGKIKAHTVSDKDFEEEPASSFARAVGETLGIKDFTCNEEPDRLHLSADFESETVNVGGDYWVDAAEGSAALRLEIPEIFDFSGYVSGTKIALESKAALNGTYGTDIKNIDEKIKTAKIWESLGTTYDELFAEMDREQRAMIEALIKSVGEIDLSAMKDNSEKLTEKYGKEFMSILNGAKHSAKTETVELSDGKVKAVVLNYSVDGKLVKELAGTYKNFLKDSIKLVYGNMLDGIPEFSETLDEMYEMYDELGNEFDGEFKTFDLNLAVAAKTGKLVMAEINAENYESGLYRVVLDLGVKPENSKQYILSYYENGALEGEIVYNRENDNGVYKRTAEIRSYDDNGGYETEYTAEAEIVNNEEEFKADVKIAEETETDFDMSLEYDKKTEKFSLSENTSGISLSGSFKYSENNMLLIIDNFNGDSGMKLTVALDDEKCPQIPEYVDILELSPEQIQSIAAAFQSFTQNVSAMFGMEYYDDDYYDDYGNYGDYDDYDDYDYDDHDDYDYDYDDYDDHDDYDYDYDYDDYDDHYSYDYAGDYFEGFGNLYGRAS